MTLKVISAEKILFEGEVNSVTLPGELGSFTVLKNHASLISVLVSGKLAFTTSDGKQEMMSISSGIADIDNNVISVCVY